MHRSRGEGCGTGSVRRARRGASGVKRAGGVGSTSGPTMGASEGGSRADATLIRQLVRQLEKAEVRCCAAEETAVHQQRYIAVLEKELRDRGCGGGAGGPRAADAGEAGDGGASQASLASLASEAEVEAAARALEGEAERRRAAEVRVERLEAALHESQLQCLAQDNKISSLARELDEQSTIAQFTLSTAVDVCGDAPGGPDDAPAAAAGDDGPGGAADGSGRGDADCGAAGAEADGVGDPVSGADGEGGDPQQGACCASAPLLEMLPPLDLCASGFDFRQMIVDTLLSVSDEPVAPSSPGRAAGDADDREGECMARGAEEGAVSRKEVAAVDGETGPADVERGNLDGDLDWEDGSTEEKGGDDEEDGALADVVAPMGADESPPRRLFRGRSASASVRRRLSHATRGGVVARARAPSLW